MDVDPLLARVAAIEVRLEFWSYLLPGHALVEAVRAALDAAQVGADLGQPVDPEELLDDLAAALNVAAPPPPIGPRRPAVL